MTKYVVEKAMFLSQICIEVTLPSPQNKTTLNPTTYVISVLSYDIFYLQIAMVEIILPKLLGGGLE